MLEYVEPSGVEYVEPSAWEYVAPSGLDNVTESFLVEYTEPSDWDCVKPFNLEFLGSLWNLFACMRRAWRIPIGSGLERLGFLTSS